MCLGKVVRHTCRHEYLEFIARCDGKNCSIRLEGQAMSPVSCQSCSSLVKQKDMTLDEISDAKYRKINVERQMKAEELFHKALIASLSRNAGFTLDHKKDIVEYGLFTLFSPTTSGQKNMEVGLDASFQVYLDKIAAMDLARTSREELTEYLESEFRMLVQNIDVTALRIQSLSTFHAEDMISKAIDHVVGLFYGDDFTRYTALQHE